MQSQNLPEFLERGDIARLIPVVPDSQKELKVVSAVLATFRIVPEFALALLKDVGAPTGKTAKIECYTEVVFKNGSDNSRKARPDGLLRISMGKRTWTAIIEAKAGNAKLTKEQVEEYLDIAKKNGVDAVITISNQYAVLPTHHPLDVSKSKTRVVDLFHFSWAAIASRAIVLSESKKISDVEQAIVLDEIIRFLRHDSSGVMRFSRMAKGWRDTASKIQQQLPLKGTDADLLDAIGSWHELTKFLCLELSTALGEVVTLKLSKDTLANQNLKLAEDIELMIENQTLSCEFDIPDTVGNLKLTADFLRRVAILSVEVDAPKDRARTPATVNWLTRQIPESPLDSMLLVRARWPRRTEDTAAYLLELRENPSAIVGDSKGILPKSFEIIRTIDLGGRFIQSQNIVDDLRSELHNFYKGVVQHLKEWIPSAPKIRTQTKAAKETEPENLVEAIEDAVTRSEITEAEPSEAIEMDDLSRLDTTSPVNSEETTKILTFLTKKFG